MRHIYDRPLSLNARYHMAWEDGTLTPELENEWLAAIRETSELRQLRDNTSWEEVAVARQEAKAQAKK